MNVYFKLLTSPSRTVNSVSFSEISRLFSRTFYPVIFYGDAGYARWYDEVCLGVEFLHAQLSVKGLAR